MRPLGELVEAYRKGDPAAQQELLTRLESQLRMLVRALLGKQIRTERESMDVCQSLLLAFHLQAQAGKVKLEPSRRSTWCWTRLWNGSQVNACSSGPRGKRSSSR